MIKEVDEDGDGRIDFYGKNCNFMKNIDLFFEMNFFFFFLIKIKKFICIWLWRNSKVKRPIFLFGKIGE